MLQLIRNRTPEVIKDWAFARRELADLQSMQTYLKLRRLRRRFRSGETDLVAPSSYAAIRLKDLGGRPFLMRPGTSDIDVVWEALIRKHSRPPPEVNDADLVLDLGANIGATMVHAATRFPKAHIVGVEIDAGNAALCRRNVEPWSERCRLIEAAIWSSDGEIFYSSIPGQEWAIKVTAGTAGNEATALARTVSINTLLHDLGASWIDYVKMDIEGAERAVLSARTEWAARVGCIRVEIHTGYAVEDCTRDLEALGFSVRRVGRGAYPTLVGARSSS